MVKSCSLCGLGQTAPNPVLSTLNYFRDEYESHIKEKRCIAAQCDSVMISPCQHTCPVGINVPKYVAHIAEGEYQKSIDTIRERNPFPSVCGRICHHPREMRCRRGELDEPVAIRSLKRFAADWYFDVEIRYNSPINVGYTVDDLKKEGFDAVYIAAGAQRSERVGIPGEIEGLDGLHYGLRFLRDVKIGREVRVGDRVAVIGGGNVALDAARTALRLGAGQVDIYYRRSRAEMPVTEIEYDEAVAEGVNISFLTSPTRIVNQDW